MLSKLHKGHRPFIKMSGKKTDYRICYQGRRVILDRDCGQGPSEQAVVVFELEIIRLN